MCSYINGKLAQKGNIRDMIFDIPYLVSYISGIMTLEPGDIILTGTPGGYGKEVYIRDKVKVEIDTTLNEQDGKLIYEVVETSVRWARQWLQSETGEKKKEEVLKYVSERLNALGIEVDAEYIDKLIESVYDTIKSERIA